MCNHVHVEGTQLNGKYDYYWILLVILVLQIEETVFLYLNFNSYAGIKILLFVYSFSVFWTKRGLLTSSSKSKITPGYVCVCIYTLLFIYSFHYELFWSRDFFSAKSIVIVLILYSFKFMFHHLNYNFLTFALFHYVSEKFWKFL